MKLLDYTEIAREEGNLAPQTEKHYLCNTISIFISLVNSFYFLNSDIVSLTPHTMTALATIANNLKI